MIRSIRLTLSWIGLAAVAMIVPRCCAEGDMIAGTLAHIARLMQLMRGAQPKKTEERYSNTPPKLTSVELIPFGVARQRCRRRRR